MRILTDPSSSAEGQGFKRVHLTSVGWEMPRIEHHPALTPPVENEPETVGIPSDSRHLETNASHTVDGRGSLPDGRVVQNPRLEHLRHSGNEPGGINSKSVVNAVIHGLVMGHQLGRTDQHLQGRRWQPAKPHAQGGRDRDGHDQGNQDRATPLAD